MVPVTYLRQSLALKQSVDGGIENSPGSIKSPHMAALLTLLMYIIHVALRLKETVRDQPKTDARMHIGQYGVGIIYYIVTPLAVVADAYCVPGWTMPPVWAALAGIALYIYASVHQWRCHHILYRLRSRAMVRQSIEHKYVVPDGDLFSLVSCPHFLCEIVIYVSIWTAAGFQATTLVWTICWTVVNLGITARETQQWYRQKFGPEYPQGRKALVPYVW
ncbi:hypothetical protein IWW45_002161 [Coemansia sp. RSA 485]|nr:hypothetical protein IWW45_002161 [Coemansia sp. RSA 485]